MSRLKCELLLKIFFTTFFWYKKKHIKPLFDDFCLVLQAKWNKLNECWIWLYHFQSNFICSHPLNSLYNLIVFISKDIFYLQMKSTLYLLYCKLKLSCRKHCVIIILSFRAPEQNFKNIISSEKILSSWFLPGGTYNSPDSIYDSPDSIYDSQGSRYIRL